MNTMIKSIAAAWILLFNSYSSPHIDKKCAADMVKEKLSLPDTVTAQELKGGLSGATLFKVVSNSDTYVIRSLTHQFTEKKEEPQSISDEITCQQIASHDGYGPHVYNACSPWRPTDKN